MSHNFPNSRVKIDPSTGLKIAAAATLAATLLTVGEVHGGDLAKPLAPIPQAAPLISWTGFYIGANGGLAWATDTSTITPFGILATTDVNPFSATNNAFGTVFGVHAGANWQSGWWVIGLEGDFDGVGLAAIKDTTFPARLIPSRSDSFSLSTQIRDVATARARLGYTWGPGMVYVTGGGAWQSLTINGAISSAVLGQAVTATTDITRTGFVVGAGTEWQLTANWLARAEYLFYDFSTPTTTSLALPGCVPSCGVSIANTDRTMSVFRLGLTYKF